MVKMLQRRGFLFRFALLNLTRLMEQAEEEAGRN